MEIEYEIHKIKTSFLFWHNYCYIVIDKLTKQAFIIDPAWEINKITDKLRKTKVDLVAIFLTHSHNDHINLVDPLVKLFNTNVFMSEKEIDYYKFRCNNLNALNNNDAIYIGNTEVSCLLTPGHTLGGMCYRVSDNLFTGDTVFIEGCGICSGDGSSATEMFYSIQRLKALIPSYVRIYPSHSYGKNPGQTMAYLKEQNIYFQINKKQDFINFRMRKNQKGIFNFK